VKVFMGGDFEAFVKLCKQAFTETKIVKPEASVARGSKEVYLVCRGLRRQESAAISDASEEAEQQG
jgi:23S rRNA U2552 (ribose-2'-O)-methylase RlmE/FtsJ